MNTSLHNRKEVGLAYLFLILFGAFGAHQFYLGRVQKALWIIALYLCAMASIIACAITLFAYGLHPFSLNNISDYSNYSTVWQANASWDGLNSTWILWLFVEASVVFWSIATMILVVDFFSLPTQVNRINAGERRYFTSNPPAQAAA